MFEMGGGCVVRQGWREHPLVERGGAGRACALRNHRTGFGVIQDRLSTCSVRHRLTGEPMGFVRTASGPNRVSPVREHSPQRLAHGRTLCCSGGRSVWASDGPALHLSCISGTSSGYNSGARTQAACRSCHPHIIFRLLTLLSSLRPRRLCRFRNQLQTRAPPSHHKHSTAVVASSIRPTR